MEFEYEITADEFTSAQILYYRLSQGRKRVQGAITCMLVGSFFLVVAWNQRPFDWAQAILAGLGAWWIYSGVWRLILPRQHFRKSYRVSELSGKRFHANLNSDGFQVTGDLVNWRIGWSGVRLKGEDDNVFILYSAYTIFIFGKHYLTRQQHEELRRLTGLQASMGPSA